MARRALRLRAGIGRIEVFIGHCQTPRRSRRRPRHVPNHRQPPIPCIYRRRRGDFPDVPFFDSNAAFSRSASRGAPFEISAPLSIGVEVFRPSETVASAGTGNVESRSYAEGSLIQLTTSFAPNTLRNSFTRRRAPHTSPYGLKSASTSSSRCLPWSFGFRRPFDSFAECSRLQRYIFHLLAMAAV